MEMTFVNIKYEKDGFSDTINISKHSEYVDDIGRDYIIDTYACIAAVFDRVLNKYFISTDRECKHGGHKYTNITGNKAAFQKTFREVFSV